MKTPPPTLRNCRSVLAALASGWLFLTLAASLHAQATKIFVASAGNDANDGSRGSPKRTFQAAHDAVAAGGQIVVLDTAGYGTLNINKSLAVTVPPGVNGFITVTDVATNGITINAGSTDTISLRGLIVEYSGGGVVGQGIVAIVVGNLVLEDCAVRNFGEGIRILAAGNLKLYVHNCTVRGCSAFGLEVDTSSDPGGNVYATVSDCRVEATTNGGVVIFNNNGTVDLTLTGCIISGNGQGVFANGSNAVARVSNCTITGNAAGIVTNNSGSVLSRGNNTLENNADGNVFPATYTAK